MSEGKDRLLAQMKDAEGAVYVLISGFTKEPYVECDKETYDDKVFVYMEEEAAKAKAEAICCCSLPTFILWESMHWKSIMRIRWI